MPLKQFKLLEEAEKKRASFKIFLCSALIGASFGLLARLIFLSPFTCEIIVVAFALVVFIVIVSYYAMRTALRPNNVNQILEVYLAYSKDRGMLVPTTNQFAFIMKSFMMFRDLSEKNLELVNVLKTANIDSIQKVMMDLVVYELLSELSSEYCMGWAPKFRYRGVSYERFGFKGDKEGVKSKEIQCSDLPEKLLKDNSFFRLLNESQMGFGKLKITVPIDTKVSWSDDQTWGGHRFSFHNKYCKIDLAVSKSGWMVGLSPIWGKYVVAKSHDEENSLTYLQDHYAHATLELSFHAQFSWFWSLWRSSDDYFVWVEDMLERLDRFFSFEREYQELKRMKRKIELD